MTNLRRLSPDDVLTLIVQMQRQMVALDEMADPDAKLTFDSTVQEWREAGDLLDCRSLGQALNHWFGTSYSPEQWWDVLTPQNEKTLRDVCDFVAQEAVAPAALPVSLLGRQCMTAGVFSTIRDILITQGVDPSQIRPSAPLEPLLREHWATFVVDVTKLAPGRLPLIKLEKPAYDRAISALILSFLGIVVFGIAAALTRHFASPLELLAELLLCAAAASFLFSYLAVGIIARRKPTSAQWGDLKTLKDLCRLIAASDSPCR